MAQDGEAAACPRWQEAYHCLRLLERLAASAPGALAWSQGSRVQALWAALPPLLLHRHLWVRKAAGRLIGVALAAPDVAPGFFGKSPARAGELALAFFLQLDCEAADEATALQAVKCLVGLSARLLAQWKLEALAAGAAGAADGSGNGAHATLNGKQRAALPAALGGARFGGSLPAGADDDSDGVNGDGDSEAGSSEGGEDEANGGAEDGENGAGHANGRGDDDGVSFDVFLRKHHSLNHALSPRACVAWAVANASAGSRTVVCTTFKPFTERRFASLRNVPPRRRLSAAVTVTMMRAAAVAVARSTP